MGKKHGFKMTKIMAVLASFIFKCLLPLEFHNLYTIFFFLPKNPFIHRSNCLLRFPRFIPVLSKMKYIV